MDCYTRVKEAESYLTESWLNCLTGLKRAKKTAEKGGAGGE